MKNHLKILLATGCLFSTSLLAQSITFEIDGVKNDQGKLLIQLFNSEDNYNENHAHLANIVNASKGKVVVTFNNVQSGEYAIRYFHDENNNGSLETNLFGMPTEGYGYSNNAKANFGPATYKDMKFNVNNNDVINQSSVNY